MEKNTEIKKPRQRLNAKLTVVVMIFAIVLIASIVLLFFVSKSIESHQGADMQIKLSGQGGFNCEYSEAQKLYPFADATKSIPRLFHIPTLTVRLITSMRVFTMPTVMLLRLLTGTVLCSLLP